MNFQNSHQTLESQRWESDSPKELQMAIASIRKNHATDQSVASSLQRACRIPLAISHWRFTAPLLVLFAFLVPLLIIFDGSPQPLRRISVMTDITKASVIFATAAVAVELLLLAYLVSPYRLRNKGTVLVNFGAAPNATRARLLLLAYFIWRIVDFHYLAIDYSLATVMFHLTFCLMGLIGFWASVQRTKLTTKGILTGSFSIPWNKVISYHWELGSPPTVAFRLKYFSMANSVLPMKEEVREAVQEVLEMNQIPRTRWTSVPAKP